MMHHGKTFASALLSSMVLVLATSIARADDFTPAQRGEIVSIVRKALKSDPSILRDAILSLRSQEEQAQRSDSEAAVTRNKDALAGTPGDFIAGNTTGNVTVVEFYDPRCPYCRRSLPELDKLVAADSKLRLVEKLIPILGPYSILESRAIEAAGRQGKYQAMQHALMQDSAKGDAAQIRTVAAKLGLDIARLDKDMASPAIDAELEANVALARQLGITGTPSFVVGGKIIPGAVSLGDLQQAVAAARTG